MMAVILVLRLVIMVPLVNIDRAKTVAAQADPFWSRQAAWVLTNGRDNLEALEAYRTAFSLDGRKLSARQDPIERKLIVEAVDADSNILVVEHAFDEGRFIAMNVQDRGHAMSFRLGRLLWSQVEEEWFSVGDSLDYGKRPESRRLENEFRAFTKETRGY